MECEHQKKKYTSQDGWICRTCDKPLAQSDVPAREGFPYVAAAVFTTSVGKQKAVAIDAKEERWNKDIPAYKRLRKQGFQPVGIDGSAKMESEATTRFEIESGKIMLGKEKQIAEAIDIVHLAGASDVFTPITTPKSEVA